MASHFHSFCRKGYARSVWDITVTNFSKPPTWSKMISEYWCSFEMFFCNALTHSACLTVSVLQDLKFEYLQHPHYFPDLDPRDYY